MTDRANPTANDEIAWRPTAEYIERSRLRRFLLRHGIADYDTLLRLAAADPAWYWGAIDQELDLHWSRPYDQVLDLAAGPAWPRWFTGGHYNYVADALDRHVAPGAEPARADRFAIIWEGDDGEVRRLTLRQIHEETTRLAHALRQLGVTKGDRVGIFLPMLPETVIATLACGKIGAIFIPMFSGFGPEALASRLRDSEASLLITADGTRRRGTTIPMKQIADEALAMAPTVAHCLVIRRTGDPIAWTNYRDRWWHEAIAEDPASLATAETAGDDPYMIIYTSGTTGRPKGAVHVHAGFPVKAAHDLAFCFDLQQNDTLFWLTDLGWMMGPWAIAGGLLIGATLLLFEGTPDFPSPDRLWRLVEDHQVTHLGLAPTAVRALMTKDSSWVRNRDLASLRVLGSTGETWNPGPWRWYFDEVGGGRCPIINYSGGTETGGGIVGCVTIAPQKPCAFTGPVPGMVADVVDDAGLPLRGAVGELIVRQPWVGMTHGFWRDNERYLDTYWRRFPGLWVHGDWAEIDPDGFWFIRGRSDDTLKVAGKRIGPAEVESAAVAHPAVEEAAAIGVPHDLKGEAIVVFVVLRPDHDPSPALALAIRQTIAAGLGAAMRPQAVYLVAELPKTRNAKIMRRVIRAAFLGTDPGDTTALENPAAVAEIARAGRDGT